jgi:hypothetical protein
MSSFDVRVFAIRRRPGRRVFEVKLAATSSALVAAKLGPVPARSDGDANDESTGEPDLCADAQAVSASV